MLIYLDYSDILDESDPNTSTIKSLITIDRLFYVIAVAISEVQLNREAFESLIKTVLLYGDLKGKDKENSANIIYDYIHTRLFGLGGIRVTLEVLHNLKDLTQHSFKVIPSIQGVYFAYRSA